MRGLFRGSRGWRLVFLGAALLLALGSTLVITRSLTNLRRTRAFDQALTRAERLDRDGRHDETYQEVLREAARFARSSRDWHKLFRLAWRQPEAERWRTLDDLAAAAVSSFPRDLIWRKIGSYAAVRRGDYQGAREYLRIQGPLGEELQILQILSVLDPDRPDRSRAALLELADDHPEAPLIRSVTGALDDPAPSSLWKAWEATGVAAFARNSALAAAAAGDLSRARRGAVAFREFARSPQGTVPVDHRAAIFLSAWLGDDTWLFRELRALPPREAVLPGMLLIQADAHARQGQIEKALALYRELQTVEPAFSPIPFLNEAIILARQGRSRPDAVLERGSAYHGENPDYRFLWASLLAGRGEWLRAGELLATLDEQKLRENPPLWLLSHLARYRLTEYHHADSAGRSTDGKRSLSLAPPERREKELWSYLSWRPEALEVAGVLARHLLLRGDASGLAELRRRYEPHRASWAAALHLIEFGDQGDLARARAVVPYLFPEVGDRVVQAGETDGSAGGGMTAGRDSVSVWAAHWNESLFALRHSSLEEAREAIQRFRRWFDDASIPPAVRGAIEARILLLQAEQARLEDRPRDARRLTDRAISLTPDEESLYSYRALLAPRD
ncbi:hypothetical protein SAMN05920897_102115 [Alkalispirochaeta americana]|uniref:Tetratricopeptide repeat-containing protein n=1 Tax=Alkalispirochaeta americana TaxID=159291 RepID=A0A1N6P3Q2_9SPIO|nr:hypothetical protein [Alkalispirochaeta americana]SIP99018.1 hypothetical protein SAMN05920897_102115 [Alkalispirochaeta americana]